MSFGPERKVDFGPPVRHRRLRRRRLVSAGQILAVGLICFGLWLIFDARQLYNSASAQPFGVRRSVAMSLLRPIARVEDALDIDTLVNLGNRIVGRNETTPGNIAAQGPPPRKSRATPRRAAGLALRVPGRDLRFSIPLPPTVSQPSPAHPISILTVGDSLGEDLAFGLEDEIGSNASVRLFDTAQADTGLANTAYYNWPLNLERQLEADHPQIVVFMFGGNDWQGFQIGNAVATPGTAFWRTQYETRVLGMMDEAADAGARIVWVGLPILGPNSPFPPEMAPALNAVYERAVTAHPGAIFVSSYTLFENSAGQYAEYLPDSSGNLVEVRDTDGVHLALPGGADRLAAVVVGAIDHAFGFNLLNPKA